MTITITLQDIKITRWVVNVDAKMVRVEYEIRGQDDKSYDEGTAYFYETIPVSYDDEGQPYPTPPNYYQLPAARAQALTDITVDARAALLHLINE